MINLLKNMFRRVMVKHVPLNWLVSIEPRYLKLISDDLKTQEKIFFFFYIKHLHSNIKPTVARHI